MLLICFQLLAKNPMNYLEVNYQFLRSLTVKNKGDKNLVNFCNVSLTVKNQVDRVSETIDSVLVSGYLPKTCGRVKPKTIRSGIRSFPAQCSVLKGTV